MIVDGRSTEDQHRIVDVLIVGSGAAGVTLASELDNGIRRILLIEAAGLEVDDDLQPDTFFESIGEPADMITDQFHALGGLTRYWTGRVGMMDAGDLAHRPWIARSGWPIAWSELAALEDRAMQWCGFSPDWKGEQPPLANLSALDGRPGDLLPYAWRQWAVARERFQHWGKLARQAFAKSENVTVLLHTVMTGIGEWSGNRAKTCILKTRDGKDITVAAKHVVISCGGVETTRLLLNIAEAEPHRLAPVTPLLGRCFMQHYRIVGGTIDAPPAHSASLQHAFNRFRRPKGQHFQTGVCLSPEAQKRERLLNAAAWIEYRPIGKSWSDLNLRRIATLGFNRLAGREPLYGRARGLITLDVEQEPCLDSRIVLRDRRDRNGMREAAIDWRISPLDRKTLAFTTSRMVAWINRLGLGTARAVDGVMELENPPPEYMLDSHHHLGTTRMSASPDDGVVDGDLKVHGIDNIHVCSGSVLPTGGHVNPTLTIVALAIRLADRLSLAD